jgi:ribosomal protein S18 acetylase RimI-like enzyme
MKYTYREQLVPADRVVVKRIVKSTGFFYPEEELIAVDLVDAHLSGGIESGYHFIFCQDESGAVVGYTCFGPITGTRGSFDLYWIVVDRSRQGLGIGRRLLEETEKAVREMGGLRIYAETSSRSLYEPTQAFYRDSGYTEEAMLKDFYTPGDSKIIYVKELAQATGQSSKL